VGNGLDVTHPRENKVLEESILRNGGLMLSEQPIGVKANPTRLVARNRLQAALSEAVILAQCPAQSGSLHTMRFARKYGRESLAATFPRRTEANAGNYDLIEQNLAKPI
jgi:DNA processing protein